MTAIEMAIDALKAQKGDDLARAKVAFRGFTEAQMQTEWGQSGRTCQQILDDYQKRADEIDSAIAELKEKHGNTHQGK